MNPFPSIRLAVFTVQGIKILVPSQTTNATYHVASAMGSELACSCPGYCTHRKCKHLRIASDWLFSETGYRATLEHLEIQIAALEVTPSETSPYALAALQSIEREVLSRLGEAEASEPRRSANCSCGRVFPGGDGDTVCPRCKITIRTAWQRHSQKMKEGSDSTFEADPFADEVILPEAAQVRGFDFCRRELTL